MRPLLLFTIDVEEDMPGWEITDPISVSNVEALPRLAELCGELGVRPTYLCTYPVVTSECSAEVLCRLHARGDCEIGSHLHPWNTPPFQGVPGRAGDERAQTYYEYELGPERFRAKLETLHGAVSELVSEAPVSFRAGRFGIDTATLGELVSAGYQVDSSVTPLEDYMLKDGGPDFRHAPQLPYRPHADDFLRRGDLPIVEIPISVGFTRRISALLRNAFLYLPKQLHFRGLVSRDYLGIVDFAWLYPGRFDDDLMTKVASVLVADGSPVLNLFLHSSELVAGTSGRLRTEGDPEEMLRRVRAVLTHCLERHDAEPVTLREAAARIRPGLGLPA